MSEVHVISHPLVQDKLTRMRRTETTSYNFRTLLREITVLMGYEALRDLPVVAEEVETPLCRAQCPVLESTNIAIVPILRAGLGMVDGMLDIIPFANTGHIGMYRDETTLEPVEYLCKLPVNVEDALVLVIDPMLATGGSAIDALDTLKKKGCKNIRMMNLLAAPEGIAAVQKAHPDVDIYVASIDDGLNENAYILPGLGDAGDRIFGTK